MSLAERLRDALDRGHRQPPILLEGDVLERRPTATITPAAVLVAVVDRPEPTVILTERPETMRKHPGQISFPGGRIDPGRRRPGRRRACAKPRRRSAFRRQRST